MSNFFNPFEDFDNNNKNKEFVDEKPKVIDKNNSNIKEINNKKVNNNNENIHEKEYTSNTNVYEMKSFNTNRAAHKYLSSNTNVKPNIFNLIKTSEISDENNIKIIKYLYKKIKNDKYKDEITKFISR